MLRAGSIKQAYPSSSIGRPVDHCELEIILVLWKHRFVYIRFDWILCRFVRLMRQDIKKENLASSFTYIPANLERS